MLINLLAFYLLVGGMARIPRDALYIKELIEKKLAESEE